MPSFARCRDHLDPGELHRVTVRYHFPSHRSRVLPRRGDTVVLRILCGLDELVDDLLGVGISGFPMPRSMTILREGPRSDESTVKALPTVRCCLESVNTLEDFSRACRGCHRLAWEILICRRRSTSSQARQAAKNPRPPVSARAGSPLRVAMAKWYPTVTLELTRFRGDRDTRQGRHGHWRSRAPAGDGAWCEHYPDPLLFGGHADATSARSLTPDGTLVPAGNGEARLAEAKAAHPVVSDNRPRCAWTASSREVVDFARSTADGRHDSHTRLRSTATSASFLAYPAPYRRRDLLDLQVLHMAGWRSGSLRHGE